jgi:hypothetical protein
VGQLSAYQRRKEPSFKRPTVSILESRDTEDWESHEQMHWGIENPETPTKGKDIRLGSCEHGHVDQGIAKRG